MRINRFVARSLGVGRRKADELIKAKKVKINDQVAHVHDSAGDTDTVMVDDKIITLPKHQTVLLHKPVGYVCSRNGQGAKTIYDLLPEDLQHIKPVGRLDKDSSGMLVMTTDGVLAEQLAHPRFNKAKKYIATLNKPLAKEDQNIINKGVHLDDGVSHMQVLIQLNNPTTCTVVMSEGKNRQIRRTFAAVGYKVEQLHRFHFGDFKLGSLEPGQYQTIQLDMPNDRQM